MSHRTSRLSRRRSGSFAAGAAGLIVLAIGAGGCDLAARGADSQNGAPRLVPEVEEIFRIGSLSGGRWESFSRIVSAGFDARGNLYLLDGSERRVTVVDTSGELLRTIGEAGDGPGQFRSPLAMAVLPDGRVLVSDAGHRGFLLFGADGEFARSIPFGDGVAAPSIVLPHGENTVVYAGRGMMVTGGGLGGPGGAGGAAGPGRGLPQMPSDAPIYRLELEAGAEREVLHATWIPPRVEPQVQSSGGVTRVARATRAFEPQLHVAVLPDGTVAFADSTTYRITLIDEAGGLEVIERSVPPRAVTDRERERERARRLRELQEGGGNVGQTAVMGAGGAQPATPDPAQVRAILESQLESMLFWPEIQVVEGLVADQDGRLWVRRYGDIGEAGPIEILESEGGLRAVVPAGEMELPAAFGPDGLAAWIEHDELDVPYVRVGRIAGVP